MLSATQGKFDEAEPLCRRAIEMGEKTLGPIHPRVAIRRHNLGKVLKGQVELTVGVMIGTLLSSSRLR